MTKLPATAHTEQPWRIHEIVPDFRIEDVWRYRTPGAGPDDFPVMLDALNSRGGPDEAGPLVRFLFAIRWKLGALLGWDKDGEAAAPGVRPLKDRLPADLQAAPVRLEEGNTPLEPVYELPNECALELINKTVHGICHLGWVPIDNGEYELRMAVLVKPNGRLGSLYMAAIAPFRYLIVYPALTRQWERAWRNRANVGRGAAGASS
ncbi:DUF2867 domain-containing protein [Nocardioides speluncae]|uniref:DUF2867 domain-containing protein n=1 Tax=Nocardioides speluncae TaxID=2670337 RepID=UPI000D68FA08|nr:DUF2867 domain-containing protein [Nocardioides speluncae]